MLFKLPAFGGQQYSLLPQSTPPISPRLPAHSSRRRRFPLSRRTCLLLISVLFIAGLLTVGRMHPATALVMDDTVDHVKGWWVNTAPDEEGWEGDDRWGPVPVWLGGEDEASGRERESGECGGWDHERPEEDDPVGCVRARQYRQTVRVLEREEKGEHKHWGFTQQHNIETLRNLTRCFLPVAHADYTPCREKPLVVSGWWYSAETLTKATTGEVIWQRAIIKQLAMIGYSFIAVGPYGNWQVVAEMMPDVYQVIWNNDVETVSCVTDPRCIAKEHYVPPEGAEDLSVGVPDEERGVIPLWAMTVTDYWGAKPKEISHNDYWWNLTREGDWTYQPLGPEWIATPWALPNHTHLPYSIEEECLKLDVVAPEDRRNAAFVYGKRSAYFHYGHVSPPEFWTNLSRENDFDLILTATIEEGQPLPDGLESIGKQSPQAFQELVASVKAMVGVGVPGFSPSVYDALCAGTPVILPYFFEEKVQSEWRHYSGWSQHGPAAQIGEPYVYSYAARNFTQLQDVVRRAVATPIERYIPDDMQLPTALEKLLTYLTRPSKSMMEERVAANGGRVPQLMAGLRERCYELGRCSPMFEAGRTPAVPAGMFV
ncbi:hypothetical protein IAT38_000095 [Cryptococcus sp. DSM 104549]